MKYWLIGCGALLVIVLIIGGFGVYKLVQVGREMGEKLERIAALSQWGPAQCSHGIRGIADGSKELENSIQAGIILIHFREAQPRLPRRGVQRPRTLQNGARRPESRARKRLKVFRLCLPN